MTTTNNILSFYKGETVQMLVSAKNADGTALTSPSTQTIIIKIASSTGGEPILEFDDKFVLVSGSKYMISLTATDLEDLKESTMYFYNVWSKNGSEDPRFQAGGKLQLQKSIW